MPLDIPQTLLQKAASKVVEGMKYWMADVGPDRVLGMASAGEDAVRDLLPRYRHLVPQGLSPLHSLVLRLALEHKHDLIEAVMQEVAENPDTSALARHPVWLRDNLSRLANLLALQSSRR